MRFTDSQRRNLGLAAGVSVLAHALLLSLALSGAGAGTPGLGLDWKDRRVQTQDVRVVMVPARVAPAQRSDTPLPPQPGPVESGAADLRPATAAPAEPPAPAPAPAVRPALTTTPAPAPAAVPDATPRGEADAEAAAAMPVTPAPEATARLGSLAQATTVTADKIALDAPRQTAWAVPGEAPVPPPMTAAAPQPAASSPERTLPPPRAGRAEALARITPLAPERAVDLAQLDSSAQAARRQAEQLQAASAEAVRLEAARAQAVRQEAVRQEAARQEALRQEAARQEAAQVGAARLAAERQALARQEAARALAAQAEADTARREAARRAMGRQLDEEAARRREAEAAAAAAIAVPPAGAAAARQATPLPLSWSSARRGRLLGRADPNAELVLYAEAFARKIQLNVPVDQVREAAQQRHGHPLVTVAIRQDGSVESVSFVVSSGVPQIDEAIRRIVQAQAPYPAFPPALARDFDVVEIRRSWGFDSAVRLY